MSEGESAAWAAKLGSGHRHFGRSPDRVAKAVERAVRWNLATVPVGIEAWLGWFAYRLSPSLMRGVLGLASMSLADRGVALSGSLFGGKKR
jgi:hypothetical protein